MNKAEYERRINTLMEAAKEHFSYSVFATGFDRLNKAFDADRLPVADAAQTLWAVTGGLSQEMLIGTSPGKLIAMAKTAKPFSDYVEAMVAPILREFDVTSIAISRSPTLGYWREWGELEPGFMLACSPGFHYTVSKERCSKCADAAEFLYLQVGVTQPVLLHTDRQTILATYKSMPKTKVRVVVSNVGIPEEGGKITFDFFKGRDFVYSHVLSGKTVSQYERTIVVPGAYDAVRIEDTHKARKITVERV